MKTHSGNISQVPKNLKQNRGDQNNSTSLDFIETLNGILEGFCSNAETLATPTENDDYNLEFYNMVNEDNSYISQITAMQNSSYPLMTLEDLKSILFKKLKLNKAADIHQLSVEHLRFAGDEVLEHILEVINGLLVHVEYMSSPEIKTGCAPFIYISRPMVQEDVEIKTPKKARKVWLLNEKGAK